MNPSLNEIEMTVWKAARGAGLAWGLAEEMAQAVRWLADRGFDWAAPLVAALADAERRAGSLPPPFLGDDGVWSPDLGEAETSPILCGPLLTDLGSDVASGKPLVFLSVAQPVLMLPFAARAAAACGFALALRIDASSFCFESGLTAGAVGARLPPLAGRVVLAAMDSPGETSSMIDAGAPRRPIPDPLRARLEAWVHRTYVPASAQSRLAGAGAGLTDND